MLENRKKQPRAVRTRQKLMDALDNLLRQKEFEHISVADIAGEAGVAVGSVYSHFNDKQAFLESLVEDRLIVIEERLKHAETDNTGDKIKSLGSLRVALTLMMQAAFEQVQSDAHIIRVLQNHLRLNPDGITQTHKNLVHRALNRVLKLLEVYQSEIKQPDLEDAARMVNYFLNVIFLEKVIHQSALSAAGVAPSSDMLINASVEMLYGYLTTTDPVT